MSPLHSLAHRERRELANRKTLIMLLAAAVIATYALWRYLVGDFDHILTPVLATLLMAIAAGLNHLDDEQPLPSYLTLIASYLMLALEAPGTYPGMSLWLGLPSVLTLLLLPLAPAMLLNLVLAPLWLWLLGQQEDNFGEILRYLCLLLVASQPFVINSLQAGVMSLTASEETECNAFNARTGQQRLISEAARARALDQPFSILVVYLPQLDMLGEQFGEDRRVECLAMACDVMQEVSRQGDLLCRSDKSSFWLMLPNTGEAGALIMRERLTAALAAATQPETGSIIARARLVTYKADDTTQKLEQRLLASQLALMDLNE
ncbi:diguanylate cyclase [Cobetia sp. cqz5-12]|uniref:diguanylate cyclase domain-containing protein n=1 Tax=Cobetia sp. cqz5-12 TaxID=2609415 RepID=UPI0019058432|nr:diguanylate cyclase [Cobetia sp. cqz5-12]QQK63391.1 diguanylate cyclase [Cobetia sp. cqz5-12]